MDNKYIEQLRTQVKDALRTDNMRYQHTLGVANASACLAMCHGADTVSYTHLAGAQFIHTVDLDGALKGHGVNAETIKKICSSVNVPVQMGGGIRTLENIQEVLDLGVYRVIIGTKAVENPDFIKAAIDRFGAEHIVCLLYTSSCV